MLDQHCAVDGSINVLDIVRIRNKALGRVPLCSCATGLTGVGTEAAAALATTVSPISITLVKDGRGDFLVEVHGAVDLSGLQIELRGAVAKARVSLAGTVADQRWQANTTLSQGILKVVTFSNAAAGISGDGAILRISGGGNIRIKAVVASDSLGREIPVE
jgi:hypothetical protein